MLQNTPIEIDDIERSVGTVEQIHGAETLVRRGEKLRGFVGVGSGDFTVLLGKFDALDEITRRLRNKGVAAKLRGKQPATINHRATGRRHRHQFPFLIERFVAAIDARRHAAGKRRESRRRDLHVRAGRRELRIAAQIRRRHGIDPQRVAVAVVINAAHVVLRNAPLAAGDRAVTRKFPGAFIAKTRREVRRVNPVVQHPHQTVGVMLGIRRVGVILRDFRLRICHAVAVRVAHEPQVRWLPDQYAIANQRHRARHHEVLRKNGALVHPPVAIRILEHRDHSERLVFTLPINVVHVTAHFEHPELSVRRDLHRDRVAHERVCRDEFNVKPLRDRKRFQRLFRRQDRRGRDHDVRRWRSLHFADPVTALGEQRRSEHQGDGDEAGRAKRHG